MTFRDPKLKLDREGNWFSDGEEITHPRTAKLFSRSVRRTPEGTYQVVVGEECCPVEVEDTPFMVRRVDFLPDRVWITLNDDSEEDLDLTSLEIGKGNVLYCRVKGGEFPARFLRPAYYHFASRVEYNEADRYHIEMNGRKHPVRFPGE